jgi:hypothetical protein
MARQPSGNGNGMTGDEKARLAVIETKHEHLIQKVDEIGGRQLEFHTQFTQAHLETHKKIEELSDKILSAQSQVASVVKTGKWIAALGGSIGGSVITTAVTKSSWLASLFAGVITHK